MANDTFELMLNNVTLYYPMIQEGRFDKGNPEHNIPPKYKVNVLLDDENLAKVNKAGLTVRSPTEAVPGPHIIPASNLEHPPKIIDSKGNKVPKELSIGNESVANIKLWCAPWKRGKESGVSAKISGIQIVKLVEYSKGDFKAVDGGYTVNTSSDVPNDEVPF